MIIPIINITQWSVHLNYLINTFRLNIKRLISMFRCSAVVKLIRIPSTSSIRWFSAGYSYIIPSTRTVGGTDTASYIVISFFTFWIVNQSIFFTVSFSMIFFTSFFSSAVVKRFITYFPGISCTSTVGFSFSAIGTIISKSIWAIMITNATSEIVIVIFTNWVIN